MATTIDAENAKQIRKSMDILIQVTPKTGEPIIINNDNLISCVVSLRSDLSLVNPTLPESEIEVQAFLDTDLSAELATIPDETPITYQAGYPGDMSPVRKFYLSEQITWADNVMTIHGVDAVHLLDVEIKAPLKVATLNDLLNVPRYFIQSCGIEYTDEWQEPAGAYDVFRPSIIKPGNTIRDVMAFYNISFNVTDSDGYYETSLGSSQLVDPCQFIYVDAGIPHLRHWREDETKWDIYEEDCGDVKRETKRRTNRIRYSFEEITDVDESNDKNVTRVGSGTTVKSSGTSLTFDKMTLSYVIGLYLGPKVDNDVAKKLLNKYGVVYGLYNVFFVAPPSEDGDYVFDTYNVSISYKDWEGDDMEIGQKLAYGEIEQSDFSAYPPKTAKAERGYSQFVPWSTSPNGWKYTTSGTPLIKSMLTLWNVMTNAGIIESGVNSLDVDIYGFCFEPRKRKTTAFLPRSLAEGIIEETMEEPPIIGTQWADVYVIDEETQEKSIGHATIFPTLGYTQRLYKSNITGSFVWKGDPRMQPKDVVQFHRLDGTVEDITLENITITHEGGGTSAEITYRKGIC